MNHPLGVRQVTGGWKNGRAQSLGRRSANGAKARSGKSLQSLGGGGGCSDCCNSVARAAQLIRCWLGATHASLPLNYNFEISPPAPVTIQFWSRTQKKNVRHANPADASWWWPDALDLGNLWMGSRATYRGGRCKFIAFDLSAKKKEHFVRTSSRNFLRLCLQLPSGKHYMFVGWSILPFDVRGKVPQL